MPPAAARDYFVILFDINTEHKNEAIHTLIKLNYLKILTPSKDNCKIVLTNVDNTNNVKGYKNIYALDINELSPKALRESINEFSPGECCWVDALQVGIEYLKNEHGKSGIITLQLLFITDFKNVGCNGKIESKINSVIHDLKEYEIYLYIFGPPVEPRHTLMSITDLEKWMRSLSIDKTDENISLVKRIVDNTSHTVISSFRMGIHIFMTYKNSKGSQPWIVPLSFGTKLSLPALTSRITKDEPPFKLIIEGTNHDFGKWATTDDEKTEVDISECISGVIRHGKFIRIAHDGMFKCSGQRNFGVLGFTDSSNICEYIMAGEATYFVLPDFSKGEHHAEVLTYLILKLAELKKYVVARRVYNKDNVPKFFVLVPRPDMNPSCFIAVELPYADDIRFNYVEMNPGTSKNIEQSQECVSFLDSINIHEEDCEINVPLGPCMMFDPNCINVINKIEEKYSKNPLQIADIDIDLSISNKDSIKIDRLRNIWKAREIVKVSKVEQNADQDELEEYAEIFDF